MQKQLERLLISKPGWDRTIRYALLAFLFVGGIFSVSGSLFQSYDPPPMYISSKERVKWKQEKINAQLEVINGYNASLATAKNPEHRAHIQAALIAHRKKLAQLKAELKALQQQGSTGACFTADMWVLTDGGAKLIGDIEVGDRVLSVDEAGLQVVSEVLKTYADRNSHYYLINDKIKATGMHRFRTATGWKRAVDLEVGDRIQTTAGIFKEIVSKEWVPGDLDVYNLHISKNHNFFISPEGQNGYLVHNTAGGGGGGGGK